MVGEWWYAWEQYQEMIRQTTDLEKIFAKHIYYKRLIQNI